MEKTNRTRNETTFHDHSLGTGINSRVELGYHAEKGISDGQARNARTRVQDPERQMPRERLQGNSIKAQLIRQQREKAQSTCAEQSIKSDDSELELKGAALEFVEQFRDHIVAPRFPARLKLGEESMESVAALYLQLRLTGKVAEEAVDKLPAKQRLVFLELDSYWEAVLKRAELSSQSLGLNEIHYKNIDTVQLPFAKEIADTAEKKVDALNRLEFEVLGQIVKIKERGSSSVVHSPVATGVVSTQKPERSQDIDSTRATPKQPNNGCILF